MLDGILPRKQRGKSFFSSRPLSGAVGGMLVAAFMLGGAAAAQEVLQVPLNKSTILNFGTSVQTVVIGKPEIADVSMESQSLMLISGKSVGETNLYVLDKQGKEVARYNIVVAPEDDRHVTVHRSTDALWTYSCNPRCIVIKNPTDVVGTAFVPPAAPAPMQPVPAPATAVSPAPAPAASTSTPSARAAPIIR